MVPWFVPGDTVVTPHAGREPEPEPEPEPELAPLPLPDTIHLLPRQSSTEGSSSCPSTISGGAIAGIVIGSIAGTLLLIWLWRTCIMTTRLNSAEKTGAPVFVGNGYPTNEATTHYRQRRRRSPVYEYSEKPRYARSRVGSGGGSVKRPRKVYLSS
ncbi:hypothetical protein BJX99DRAFT_255833 [Aspergillus californicus]